MARQHIETNAKTGEVSIRDYTPEEEAKADAIAAQHAEKNDAKASARAEIEKPMPNTLPGIAQRLAAIETLLGLK